MRTLTDLLTDYLEDTKDNTAGNKSRGIRRMNEFQRRLEATPKSYWWRRKEFTFLSQAGVSSYQAPKDILKPKKVKVTIGGIDYNVQILNSDEEFDRYNSQGLVQSDYVTQCIFRDGKILFYPYFSSATVLVTVLGDKRPIDMKLEDYVTGTVSISNGSKTVTGSGTAWSGVTMRGGVAYIFLNFEPYEIATVDSTTQITLVKSFEGANLSGATYRIGDVSAIHEAFQDILYYKAVMSYYAKKEDDNYAVYDKLYKEMWAEMMNFGNTAVHKAVRQPSRLRLRTKNDQPTIS